jgi:TatD DNase family protein
MLLDTHCHLTHERYGEELPDVLDRAREAGVQGVICVASNLGDAEEIASLAEGRPARTDEDGTPRLWGTAGLHPHEASTAPREFRRILLDTLDSHSSIVAVGECGLDFHYDLSPRTSQRRVFDLHLEVAVERDLPLVVHCREAEVEMAARVLEAGRAGVRGVLHCFTGDRELLDAALEAEWLVSFTGIVTFPSFAGTEAVRRVPGDRYMLETDGPYMAPVPHRGKRNEPAFVSLVRDRVAELREESPDAVASSTTETARRFFRLD